MNQDWEHAKDLVTNMTYLQSLNTDQLILISRQLYSKVNFCECVTGIQEDVNHKCKLFSPRDFEHSQSCQCCQTQQLSYFWAQTLQKLADNNELPQFNKGGLSRGKIANRTCALEKNGPTLQFAIIRHPGAFRITCEDKIAIQKWEFDFEKLTLIRKRAKRLKEDNSITI